MKIKLAILEKDTVYLQRIISAFHNKYADKLEIYSFTEEDTAEKTLQAAKINVLLAGEEYGVDIKQLPERCAFAYFVESPEVQTVNGCAAVCKFQKIDMIYKQVVSLYSEVAADIGTNFREEEGSCRVISFLSPAGGVGCSTAAVACAMYFVRQGRRALYLNLEKYGSTSMFLQGMGQGSLSDVLYAIKSQKLNLALKLEGVVQQDKSGVCFLPECGIVLDRLEMKPEELAILLKQIKLSEGYDDIILDADFSFDGLEMEVMKQAGIVVLVSDGSRSANLKLERACKSMEILEQQGGVAVLQKTTILYNQFHTQTGKKLELPGIGELGGIPKFRGIDEMQVAAEISKGNVFEGLA